MHIESIKLTEIYKPIASILRLHYVVNSATGALPETIGACSVMSYLWFCCKQCIKEIIIICYGLGKHYRGALVYRLGAYEPTCTLLATPMVLSLCIV